VRSWGAKESLQVLGLAPSKGRGKGKTEHKATVQHVVALLPHLHRQPSDLRCMKFIPDHESRLINVFLDLIEKILVSNMFP